jgi:tRNA-uridine 2-sulfurtransferase
VDKKKRVVVAMSGGVDSSLAACLLKEQGYEVLGLFMKNWEEADGSCVAEKDFADVSRVCEKIDIPYYTVNFTKEYWDDVFSQFLKELEQGLTPNPDILCNREIKFKSLWQKAQDLGADFLATGHYCRIRDHQLLRGIDNNKDQSYFLYTLKAEQLPYLMFPIGHLKKERVRALAAQRELSTATKKDSTGICFIGKRNFKSFISHYLPFQKGTLQTLDGQIIGQHDGVAYYTIGQRKGLNIGGPGKAWFVVGKDVKKNIVFVEQGEDHPALWSHLLQAKELSWITPPPALPFHCTAKIRYRHEDQPCFVQAGDENCVQVHFQQPQRAITAGQSIVFYQNETCLGGGVII